MSLGIALLVFNILLAIAVLAYFRYVSRRNVAPLLRAMIARGTKQGMTADEVLRETAAKLRRRTPFSYIKEKEMNFFLDVLRDLAVPVDVAAQVWQKFELRCNVSSFREQQTLLLLAYMEDLELSVRKLIKTAVQLQQSAGGQYPNIAIALLAAISRREGWVFAEERADSVVFKYLENPVSISMQSSGKDVARAVFFEEMRRRLPTAPDSETYEARKSGRQAFMDNFDRYFDQIFQKIGQT